MGGVLWGLALFFGLLWAVSSWRRRSEAQEEAAFQAERDKQYQKWVAGYTPSRDDVVPGNDSLGRLASGN
jgi:hypothetical protein